MASEQQCKDFIARIAPLIQKEALSRGYKVCSAVIAQACLESGWGLSGLAKYHNYFGLKCGSSWKGKSVNMSTKEEYTVGTLTTIKDNFRVFDSIEAGVSGYYDFISTTRYANLKTAATAQQYLEMIKSDGYATSSSYVKNNMTVVTKYNLTQYDRWTAASIPEPVNGNPYQEPTKNVRLNSKGNDVRWLQFELNRRGYKLIVDGIAGNMTIGAVMDFQKKAGLAPDGICGPLTRAALKS